MLAKCPATAFLQGELKKTGKKREPSQTSQKASQEPNQTSQKASQKPNQTSHNPIQTSQKASQEPNQTSQEPNQTSQKASQEPESQPGAKPNQPGAKPNQPESQPGAKPEAKPEANQKKPARVSFEGARLAETQLLGILPNRISRGLCFAASRLHAAF